MFQSFTPRQYLMIDIASNFGLDKVSWQERLDWFFQNEGTLEAQVKKAKEPALYYAGVKAWRDITNGLPTGYMISLDATSSGLQLLACLVGDRKASTLCNVVDTGDREDAYVGIYNHMLQVTGGNAQIDRVKTKQAIMTAFYSSTAVPKEVFGEGQLLEVFYNTLAELAPGAWELNEAFLGLWDPDALSHDWVLPDNFHVHVKVMGRTKETIHFLDAPYDVFTKVNAPTEEGRSLGANTIHSIDGLVVREMTRRCSYDREQIIQVCNTLAEDADPFIIPDQDDFLVFKLWDHYQRCGYLSARILDHIKPSNVHLIDRNAVLDLIQSLPKNPFTVLSIHDCFRCLPTYGDDLRKQYNLQLSLIAKSNMLSYLFTQLIKRPVTIGKLDANLWKDVVDSNYALS